MKRLLSLILCLLLCFPALASALSADAIDSKVDTLFGKSHTTGGALVVVKNGEILYQRYYGYQNIENLIPVTEDTYFRIASVTKMVSGIGLMQLWERGLVDLDEDISTYFGYEIASTRFPDTPITLRQLMSHTAGLSISGGYGSSNPIYEMLSKDVHRRANFTKNEAGTTYEYSNFGAGVAGAILEAVTDVSVNQYMRENVFSPLGIDASYNPNTLQDQENIATLYNNDGSIYHTVAYFLRQPYEDFADPEAHYRTTVGSLWIRARDLAALTVALCGNGTVNGVELLSRESLSLMRSDQASFQTSVTGESPYGLFLQREETLIDGHTFYGHQGLIAGVLCDVYFEPETQFGFVLLTNGCNNVMQNHVGVLARRMLAYAYETFVTDEDYNPWGVQ